MSPIRSRATHGVMNCADLPKSARLIAAIEPWSVAPRDGRRAGGRNRRTCRRRRGPRHAPPAYDGKMADGRVRRNLQGGIVLHAFAHHFDEKERITGYADPHRYRERAGLFDDREGRGALGSLKIKSQTISLHLPCRQGRIEFNRELFPRIETDSCPTLPYFPCSS